MLEWGASSKTNLNLNMTDYTMSIKLSVHQPFSGNQPLLHVYIYPTMKSNLQLPG